MKTCHHFFLFISSKVLLKLEIDNFDDCRWATCGGFEQRKGLLQS